MAIDLYSMEYFSELLTPMIGVLTVMNLIVITYIAIQQHRIRKETLEYNIHRDLYEKRLKVFQETMELLRTIVNNQKPSWPNMMKTLRKIEDDAYFLFGGEIHAYIRELIKKGSEKKSLISKIERLNNQDNPKKEKDRVKAIDEESELDKWFFNQFEICRVKFAEYLSYKKFLR